jgi:hypothetical protein
MTRLYRIARVGMHPSRPDWVWTFFDPPEVGDTRIALGSRVEVRRRDGSAVPAMLAMQPIAPRGETHWAYILTGPDELKSVEPGDEVWLLGAAS